MYNAAVKPPSALRHLRLIWISYLVFSASLSCWMVTMANGPVRAQSANVQRQIQDAKENEHRDLAITALEKQVGQLEALNVAVRMDRLEMMVDIHNKVVAILGVPCLFILLKELMAYFRKKIPA